MWPRPLIASELSAWGTRLNGFYRGQSPPQQDPVVKLNAGGKR
jgi:hypothetical protein